MLSTDNLSQLTWRKSSYSGPNGGDCLEVGDGMASIVPVRDSKIPEGAALVFSTSAWSAFVSSTRSGGLSAD